jgi:hypothetical protein
MRRRSLLWLFLALLPLLLVGGVSWASPPAQDQTAEQLGAFVFDARADLEILATDVLGEGQRPEDWTGNSDTNSPTVVADLWFDNEQLADVIFGVNTRPEDWFGANGSNARVISRNVRHDLERLADEHFGATVRPPTWRGASPIYRCDRTLQNVLDIMVRFYSLQPTTEESVLNYCLSVAAEVEDSLVRVAFTADQAARLPDQILAIRGDIERLADELLGLNNRPSGWIGNKDVNSPTLIADNLLDLETLANAVLEGGQRPLGWIGAVTNQPATSYLNLRHDLELLADATLGLNVRPTGWQGADPIARCEPLLQNLVFLVQQNYNVSPQADVNSPDYCIQLAAAANQVVENPPILDVVENEGDKRLTAASNYAFSYLDVSATEYMGIMPGGTEFRAWYRNFGESNMMFISGTDFALFVDYRFTTLPSIAFDSLPTLEDVSPLTFCDASWCNGPGPTPTPTGFGALNNVLNQATPPPTPLDLGTQTAQLKTQVAWNHIRPTYLLDNPTSRTAQVALEICGQPAVEATVCEPVINVVDQATNTPRPPISQYNGLNVYEFRYGYTTQVLIEGATLYSNDIWISDPTIR